MTTNKHIYVVGSLNIDFSIQSSRFPNIGETLVGQGFSIDEGGKGANQAIACARAGIETIMIGAVGNDVFATRLVDTLKDEGIDVTNIEVKETTTGCAVINIADGNNKIIIDHGANFSIDKDQIDIALAKAKKGDILITQFEIPEPIIIHALKMAKRKGMVTIVNPAPSCYEISKMSQYIDYLIPNETEYASLCFKEQQSIDSIAHVVITLGSEGVRYLNSGKSVTIPARKVEAIDTTAAGDTFIGVFAAMLAYHFDIKTSLETANKAASISVTKRGAMASIPYLNEVNDV